MPKIKTFLFSLLILLFLFAMASLAFAHQEESSWSTPNNLSRSGAARAPRIVVDANGRFHILWPDDFARPTNVSGTGRRWSEPLSLVDFPFNETVPLLVPGIENMHALWLAEETRGGDILIWHSQAPLAEIDQAGSWAATDTVTVTGDVWAFVGVVDGGDRLHLATLQISGEPAGLFHQWSPDLGGSWEEAAPDRNLQSLLTKIEVVPVWDDPTALPFETGNATTPILLTDSQNRLHAFWLGIHKSEAAGLAEPAGGTFMYAQWNGEAWSRATDISNGEQVFGAPAVTLTVDNRLMAVWGNSGGQIVTTWAPVDRASVNAEWHQAQPFALPQKLVQSPDILPISGM